jgi:hypothetical protein
VAYGFDGKDGVADLDAIADGEHTPFDLLSVHKYPRTSAEVLRLPHAVVIRPDHGVCSGEPRIGQRDLRIRRPPDQDPPIVRAVEALAGAGAPTVGDQDLDVALRKTIRRRQLAQRGATFDRIDAGWLRLKSSAMAALQRLFLL